MTKKSRQKLKYPDNEKNFQGKIKRFFIILKGFSCQKLSQTLGWAFKCPLMNIRHFNDNLHIWFNEFLTFITWLCCWESALINVSESISCFRQHLIMHECPQNILLYFSFKTFGMVSEGDADLLNKFRAF